MDYIDFAHALDPPTQAILPDPDFSDEEPPNPSPSNSARNSSGPDEAIFDSHTRHSSPRTSHHSDDDISLLPADSRVPSCALEHHPSLPYTPLKTRSPFRNPSSVRAIQLDLTPPHLQQRYKLSTPTRNSTPRSTRSYHSAARSPSRLSPARKVVKEHPLVLLHVTILPIGAPYSQEVLESVVPGFVIENWKLLREKVTETVLERGILIPHPREDYDLLEERLLESLELKVPRILKCGHFHREEGDDDGEDDGEEDGSEVGDADICEDCGRRIRDGRFGSGEGSKRWEIRIYAANGLMRAGAWGAAWREMERVDVEIAPWIEDGVRRELELRKEEEMRSMPPSFQADESPQHGPGCIDADRMREIYGEDAQAYVDGFADEVKNTRPRSRQRRRAQQDIPLWILLRNYIQLMLKDRRNVTILVLSLMVLFLSVGTGSVTKANSLEVPAVLSQTASLTQQSLVSTLSQAVSSVSSSVVEDVSSALLGTSSATPSISEAPQISQQEIDVQTVAVDSSKL